MLLIIFLFIAVNLNAELFELEEIKQTFEANKDKELFVKVDIDIGELKIQPDETDAMGSIEISYQKEEYWSRIDFDKKGNHLEIKVDNDSWFNWNSDKHDNNEVPQVFITLPKNVIMNLDVRLKAGELHMQLGGISIKSLNVSSWAGETWVDFDTLNPVEMEMMRIAPRIGECRLKHLGNSRFQRAKIDGGIGELSVDFSGGLLHDSRAKVDLDIGEASIELPEEVGTQMFMGGMSFLSSKNLDRSIEKKGRIYFTENFDTANQKFYLKVSPGLGELNIDVR